MLKYIVFIIAITAFYLESWIFQLTYMDEIIAIALFFYGILALIKINREGKSVFLRGEIIFFLLMIVFAFLSVLSTVFSNVSNTLENQVYTFLASLKFVMIYFGARVLFFGVDNKSIQHFGKILIRFSYIYVIVLFFIYSLDLVLGFMQSHDYRFGLKSVAFGFGHPSEFALFLILLSIFNLYFNAKYRMRIDYLFLFLNFILLLFSGRVTALSFFALLCIILISFRFFRNYVAMGVTVSLIIAIGFAYDKIHETFIALEHARGVLLNSANLIAQDYFPFGSGLGTFGSHASRVNYSELYYSYGVSNFYGLSEAYPAFITDSYWAMMIAENGYIASIMQFLAIVILISSLYIRNKSIITIIVIYPLIYMLFTTPIDTIMLSNSSLPLVFTAAVLVSIEFKNNCKVSLKRK